MGFSAELDATKIVIYRFFICFTQRNTKQKTVCFFSLTFFVVSIVLLALILEKKKENIL